MSYDTYRIKLIILYVPLLLAIGKIALTVFSTFVTLCSCLSCLQIEKNQNTQNDGIMKMDLIVVILSNQFKNLCAMRLFVCYYKYCLY